MVEMEVLCNYTLRRPSSCTQNSVRFISVMSRFNTYYLSWLGKAIGYQHGTRNTYLHSMSRIAIDTITISIENKKKTKTHWRKSAVEIKHTVKNVFRMYFLNLQTKQETRKCCYALQAHVTYSLALRMLQLIGSDVQLS